MVGLGKKEELSVKTPWHPLGVDFSKGNFRSSHRLGMKKPATELAIPHNQEHITASPGRLRFQINGGGPQVTIIGRGGAEEKRKGNTSFELFMVLVIMCVIVRA